MLDTLRATVSAVSLLLALLLCSLPCSAQVMIDLGLPKAARGVGSVATGTTSCSGGTALGFGSAAAGTAQVDVAGTLSGGSLRVQATADGVTFSGDLALYPRSGGTTATTIAATGSWTLPVMSDTVLCVYASGFTGAATVTVTVSPAAGSTQLIQGIAASGSAGGNPVLTGVLNGANTIGQAGDSSGRTIIAGSTADGAAAAGNPLFEGLGFNGVNRLPRYCDKVLQVNTTIAAAAATVQLVAGVAAQFVYLCGYQLAISTATTGTAITWVEGTGAACATGQTTVLNPVLTTPTAAPTTPNMLLGPISPGVEWTSVAADALCLKQASTTNTTTVTGWLAYTQD